MTFLPPWLQAPQILKKKRLNKIKLFQNKKFRRPGKVRRYIFWALFRLKKEEKCIFFCFLPCFLGKRQITDEIKQTGYKTLEAILHH